MKIKLFICYIVYLNLIFIISPSFSEEQKNNEIPCKNKIYVGIVEKVGILEGENKNIYQIIKLDNDDAKYIANMNEEYAVLVAYKVTLRELPYENRIENEDVVLKELYPKSIHVSIEKLKPIGLFDDIPKKEISKSMGCNSRTDHSSGEFNSQRIRE